MGESNPNSWELTEGNDEGRMARMFKKIKEEPAVPIGMGLWTAMVGYGLYNIKNRKGRLSLYLINLRVTAQAAALTCMMGGVAYNIYKSYSRNAKSIEKSSENNV